VAFACAYAVPLFAGFALLSCFGFFFSRLLFCSLLILSLSRSKWTLTIQSNPSAVISPHASIGNWQVEGRNGIGNKVLCFKH
jgi:hypothetical protein